MNQTRAKIAQFWSTVQGFLFPMLEDELGPLGSSHQDVVRTLELVRIEDFIPSSIGMPWRPATDRAAIARAFVAKAVLNLPTTRGAFGPAQRGCAFAPDLRLGQRLGDPEGTQVLSCVHVLFRSWFG